MHPSTAPPDATEPAGSDATRDAAAIGHDPDALERFYRAHLRTVETFVARRVGEVHTAADLTADVFLTAIEQAERYRPERGSPRAWLIGIARTTVAAHRRGTAREARATARLRGRDLLDEDSAARIAARIDAQRDARALLAALADLPAGQRAVVELVAVDGLSPVEAAVVLGISPVNARVRYHRGRRALLPHLPNPPHDLHEVTP